MIAGKSRGGSVSGLNSAYAEWSGRGFRTLNLIDATGWRVPMDATTWRHFYRVQRNLGLVVIAVCFCLIGYETQRPVLDVKESVGGASIDVQTPKTTTGIATN